MMKCNNRARVKAIEPRYKWLWKGRRCYYCNDPSDTVDHVPALDVVYSLGPDWVERNGNNLWKVPACRPCNSVLGNRPIMSTQDRATFIYQRLQSKYQKCLHGRDFEWEELAEFGPNLRSLLESHWNLRGWLERKLGYMESVFDLSLEKFHEIEAA